MLAQASEQVLPLYAGMLAQYVERVAPESSGQFVRGDFVIWAITDPGLRRSAMATVLEFFDEIAKPAAQNGSSCSAAKEPPQSSRDQVVQAATRLGAGGSVSAGATPGFPPRSPPKISPSSSTRKAGLRGAAGGESRATRAGRSGRSAGSALDGFVSEETEERRHDWRHPA